MKWVMSEKGRQEKIFCIFEIFYYTYYTSFISYTFLHMPADIGAGIGLDEDCLTKGTCTLTINKTLQIKEELAPDQDTLGVVVQDVFL